MKLLNWTLLLVASLIFSGCRFGNKSTQAAGPTPYSWFSAVKQRLYLCVDTLVFDTPSNSWKVSESCADAFSPTKMDYWETILTNPLIFYQPLAGSREAYLISQDQKNLFGIFLDSPTAKTFQHYSERAQGTLFHDPQCTVKGQNVGVGELVSEAPHIDGFGRNILGHVKMSLGTYLTIQGQSDATLAADCGPTFTAIWACYNTGAGCTPDEASAVKKLLGAYIERGLLSATTFPATLGGLYYQFDYP